MSFLVLPGGGGGIVEVTTDNTLKGKGNEELPLGTVYTREISVNKDLFQAIVSPFVYPVEKPLYIESIRLSEGCDDVEITVDDDETIYDKTTCIGITVNSQITILDIIMIEGASSATCCITLKENEI